MQLIAHIWPAEPCRPGFCLDLTGHRSFLPRYSGQEVDSTVPRLSQQTKEILQIVIFLLVTGLLVGFYLVYPLNRAKAYFARPDLDTFNSDSLPPLTTDWFEQAGLRVDTVRIQPDAVTALAAWYVHQRDTARAPKGSIAILLEPQDSLGSMLPMVQLLADSGLTVLLYQQRGGGLSTGRYRGEGQLEAGDLGEVIAYFDLRREIHHPFIVAGRRLGADAALLEASEDPRIDGVVAVEPYLSTERWLTLTAREHQALPVPFFRSVLWFWYKMRSGYTANYRDEDDIRPVPCPTLLAVGEDSREAAEVRRLREISDTTRLTVTTPPDSPPALGRLLLDFASTVRPRQ